jgi:carboxypeptidase T
MVKKSAILGLLLSAVTSFSATHRVVLKPADYAGTLRLLAARQMDIAGTDRREGTIEVIADDEGLKALKALKEPLQIRSSLAKSTRAAWLEPYTDPVEMEQFLFDTAALYPDLMEIVPLTAPLVEGHIVYAVKITHGDGVKPVFLMDAQHHAREVMTSEIARDAIQYLVSRYGTDPQVTRWVDAIEIWIIPIANPDGADFMFRQSYMWRKNRTHCTPGYGVDTNRNYAFSWGQCNGSSGLCLDDTFRGESPASEPETQGITALMHAIKPLFYLTYHSYGEYIIWPLGCEFTAENDAFKAIGSTLNNILQDDTGKTGKYAIGTSFQTLYTTDGTSDDEPYGRLGTFPFCIEVNSDRAGGFQPDYATWRDVTVERQRTAWQYFLDLTLDGPLIRGTVSDPISRKAVAGAVLTVDGLVFSAGESPRTTDANGRYFFVGEKGKTYTLTFTAPGYASASYAVPLGNGPVDLDVHLLPLPHHPENLIRIPHIGQ